MAPPLPLTPTPWLWHTFIDDTHEYDHSLTSHIPVIKTLYLLRVPFLITFCMHALGFYFTFPLPHNSMILTSSGTEIVFTMIKKIRSSHLQFQYNEPDAEEQVVNSVSSFSSKLCSSKCKQFDIRAGGWL